MMSGVFILLDNPEPTRVLHYPANAYELVRSHLQVVASSQCNAAVSAWDEEYESRWRLYGSHIVSVGYHI